jgi:nucleotidyltransferase/DNA polymerase involved in DNA repair
MLAHAGMHHVYADQRLMDMQDPRIKAASCFAGGPNGGEFVTDVTNAARTNFMELSSRTWHQPTLQRFGASAAMLPHIRSNAEAYGCVVTVLEWQVAVRAHLSRSGMKAAHRMKAPRTDHS